MRGSRRAFTRILEVLDLLEVPYAIGGSVASSAHGIPRTTLDVDIVVNFKLEQIEPFVQELQEEFYADAEQLRDAFSRGRAVNLIHLETAWKFDLFPLQNDAYSQASFARRGFRHVNPDGADAVECAVLSAEDTILRKLEGYRAGGESSDRQWQDLRGVCAAAGARLDVGYLGEWAGTLRVADLLDQLLVESGLTK